MDKRYDVVIVGAGPSGSSCAYNIKRLNPECSVLLLDKAAFPRYKPCGGGISPEVANYLDFDLSPAIDYHCQDVALVANGKEIASNDYELWMVRREVFDEFLLKKAQALNVDFLGECEVSNINEADNKAITYTSKGNFESTIVIVAEGGRGKLAKKLGIAPENTVLAAMEYEHYTAKLNGKLYIDFDYNDSGYAWNFPKSDGLSLGIGGLIKGKDKGNVGLPNKLKNYVNQFEVGGFDKKNLHGHPIQLYSGRQKLVHARIVLIGEIAGCVDPLTAEGIRPAIKSGYLAAEVIAEAVAKNNINILAKYDKKFHNEIGKDFQYARIMSFFLNRYLTKILPMLTNRRSVAGMLDVFSGKSSYREKVHFKRILKMIVKVLWK